MENQEETQPKRYPIFIDGKGQVDYENLSNMSQQDLVLILETADKLKNLCKEQKIPVFICMVPNKNPISSFVYTKDIDDEKLSKLMSLAGVIKVSLQERLGIVFDYLGIIPQNIP